VPTEEKDWSPQDGDDDAQKQDDWKTGSDIDFGALAPSTEDGESSEEDEDSPLPTLPPHIAEVMEGMREMVEAVEEIKAKAQAEEADLFGENYETKITYGADLEQYDTAAYTRTEADYTSYRYNLSSQASRYGGWYNSWYAGYSSTEAAIQGVHDNVATFVTRPGFGFLEIVPNLEDADDETVGSQTFHINHAIDEGEIATSDVFFYLNRQKTILVRIDTTLYEKMGMDEAQQHYIVDAIAQTLAIESYPTPEIALAAQSSSTSRIPNVLREIVTEIFRCRGLPLLVEQMPGWLKRVTALRSALYIPEPAEGTQVRNAYLMYAIWEKDVINTLEHQEAIDVIAKIEAILDTSDNAVDVTSHLTEKLERELKHSSMPTKFRIAIRESADGVERRLGEIEQLLVDYITKDCPIGAIIKALEGSLTILDHKKQPDYLTDEEMELICNPEHLGGVMDYVHVHNNTFLHIDPDTGARQVRHQEFPACPTIALLPDVKRGRVELTRKTEFAISKSVTELTAINVRGNAGEFDKLTDEAATKLAEDSPTNPPGRVVLTRVKRRLKLLLDSMRNVMKLKSESGLGETYRKYGKTSDGTGKRSGTKSTNHDEFRSRGPISSGIDRASHDASSYDTRDVVIFDCTAETVG